MRPLKARATCLVAALALASHLEHRGGNTRRPGSFEYSKATRPVPLQFEHPRSRMGPFGQSAVLRRILLPRFILLEQPGIGVDKFSAPRSREV